MAGERKLHWSKELKIRMNPSYKYLREGMFLAGGTINTGPEPGMSLGQPSNSKMALGPRAEDGGQW